MSQDLVPLIIEAINNLSDAPSAELNADTALFGENGVLDSMGLVTLVVDVEQAIEDEYSVSVALADAKAMSRTNSPYRTIGALAEYANEMMAEGS